MVNDFKQKLKDPYFILFGIVLLALVLMSAFFYFERGEISQKTSSGDKKGSYNFINPTVQTNLGKHFIINFTPLKEKLTAIQKKYSQKTYVYFAYLNNSAWVGLNEKDLFTAASTVKVPLAMSLYKMEEEGKIKMSDTYGLEELDLNDTFGDLYKVGPDKQFTIEELVKIMLEKSDNTAANAIYKILSRLGIENPLDKVYNFMGWEFNNFGELPNYEMINLKTLTNMFVALYNANYINSENSQKILEYLTNTPFNEEIAAGVPIDIPVAHKIGVASNMETFSDCGIVYAPNRNYILCLGSNGGNENSAKKFMAEVSKAAYEFVINN